MLTNTLAHNASGCFPETENKSLQKFCFQIGKMYFVMTKIFQNFLSAP